jgi:hypothetical protein
VSPAIVGHELIDSLGIDHVTYALFVSPSTVHQYTLTLILQDFSLSFLIYLVITFLVHLYQSTGIVGASSRTETNQEAGYSKLNGNGNANAHGDSRESLDGPEAFELTDRDTDSAEEDAIKIERQEDEVDWMDPDQREARRGLRL